VDVGGWSLYLDCLGRRSPTIVVEAGLGDVALDWRRVIEAVSGDARICAYDRAGYGFSDPGPMPRTYEQINLDLHRLLAAAGERGPFILVGHSFGGPLVRQYATTYPEEVAGVVLLESAHEDMRVFYGGAAHRIRENGDAFAVIPPPRITSSGPAADGARFGEGDPSTVDPLYAALTRRERAWRAWIQLQPRFDAARQDELQHSPDSLARMHEVTQSGSLGVLPLLVLTRRHGGYEGLGEPLASEMEAERRSQQRSLARLSTRGRQMEFDGDHNPHLSAPRFTARIVVAFQREVRRRGGWSWDARGWHGARTE
jgi:pimeloyl-ACP methyl ester carboxylesterase